MDYEKTKLSSSVEADAGKEKTAGPAKALFVTNHLNLCYMLSAGMIMSPKGFKKYYKDTLSISPGWVPVFQDKVPQRAIELSVSERKSLKPVVATIDLSMAATPKTSTPGHGDMLAETNVDKAFAGDDRIMFFRAPLPVALIESIAFQNQEDKAAFSDYAEQVSNVPAKAFPVKAIKGLFEKTLAIFPSFCPDPAQVYDSEQNRAQAAGGIAGLLSNIANRGDLAMNTFNYALDCDSSWSARIDDERLKMLAPWMEGRSLDVEGDNPAHNFWKIVDLLSQSQMEPRPETCLDKISQLLERYAEANDSKALRTLNRDLGEISGFAGSTMTELFERHTSPSSRALILLFSEISSAEFLEFEHPLLSERDKVFAAILFGARDGWIGLPIELRQQPDLEKYISHRMAQLSQEHQGSGLDFGPPPPRPVCLRELFAPGDDQTWNAKQKKAALELARKSKWDCLETHIHIGKGDYPLRIDGRGMHLVFQGDVKVETVVKQDNFFDKLASEGISKTLENKIRKMAKS